jgi:hypothetical protein
MSSKPIDQPASSESQENDNETKSGKSGKSKAKSVKSKKGTAKSLKSVKEEPKADEEPNKDPMTEEEPKVTNSETDRAPTTKSVKSNKRQSLIGSATKSKWEDNVEDLRNGDNDSIIFSIDGSMKTAKSYVSVRSAAVVDDKVSRKSGAQPDLDFMAEEDEAPEVPEFVPNAISLKARLEAEERELKALREKEAKEKLDAEARKLEADARQPLRNKTVGGTVRYTEGWANQDMLDRINPYAAHKFKNSQYEKPRRFGAIQFGTQGSRYAADLNEFFNTDALTRTSKPPQAPQFEPPPRVTSAEAYKDIVKGYKHISLNSKKF